MRERHFVTRRHSDWDRLEALLTTADRRGLRRLSDAEIEALALLYRSATSDLAATQSRAYSADLHAFLNRLVARSHAYVYAGTAAGGWHRAVAFFLREFPCELRRSKGQILACTALFAAAWIVAYWLVSVQPLDAYALLPAEEIPWVSRSLHDSNFAIDRDFAPAMSLLIITNNIRVATLAFAGGMTLGILTLWEILNNGLMVGGLGALFAARGFGADFYATIAPHGVIELSAIQIAGGAGLLLAQALVAPGRFRRIDALKRNARRAADLMIGVTALLVVAGLIESFVTPQRTSLAFREGIGLLTALLLAAYVATCGRSVAVDPEAVTVNENWRDAAIPES